MASIKNIGFIAQLRSDASNHIIRYRSGKVRQSGRGLVFWFRPETASIVSRNSSAANLRRFVFQNHLPRVGVARNEDDGDSLFGNRLGRC